MEEKRVNESSSQHLSGRKFTVVLWDSFTLKLNTYILEHQNKTASVIILLHLAKLKSWGGHPQVGNCLFGSRLHINDDMPHILEFKESYIFLLIINPLMFFVFICLLNHYCYFLTSYFFMYM